MSGLLAVLLMAGMWASGSRTALATSVAGAIAVAIAIGGRAPAWQARLAPIAILLGTAITILLGAIQSGDRSNPLTRVLETLPSADEGGLPKLAERLWVRDGYGPAAAHAIASIPGPASALARSTCCRLTTHFWQWGCCSRPITRELVASSDCGARVRRRGSEPCAVARRRASYLEGSSLR